MNRKNISVLGGGSWGTVLAYLASLNGNQVNLWMRDNDLAETINNTRINKRYLPNLDLGKNITATSQIEDIKESDLIIFCVPSDAFRDVSLLASSFINENTFLVTATKGVEKDDFSLMSKILEEYYPKNLIGILSGPNLAEEIANHHLSGTVIASKHKILRDEVIQNLSTDFFRIYENDDPYGVEMGGALKNIYAIACGIADGLNSGENTIGMIMTRGLGEMSRLATDLGANPQTFLGLAGVGDLITTCASPLSRNHQFGKYIGEGLSVEEAKKKIGQTIEGLKTLKVVKNISDKHGVEMPIVDSLYKIIYKGTYLDGSIQNVLGQDMIKDVEFIK
ncbi:NAD(P)-dependent glycerol-3-phosphate dehydrogenase [Gammaproteobacteria bacterium]|jgi:glycerol-3-phosphate dehydrogenase (NAD(P)+)|nr:NAD(P)-dependent glycerol-3-phosphate dehydrogenase [Gammaproteobacteria bacterium]MDG1120058.1 NAD(P)-dependent glycerol-3-phosphate dehydrogenase [SAR86 cluster bacterium]|tara:strand:- start:1514 stop:2521 length:1008 start_codon:yes stop_codon:yes gene_type:complete